MRQRWKYTSAKVDERVRVFTTLRDNVKTQTEFHEKNWGPPPPSDAITRLRKLADEVIEWKLRLDDLESQMPDTRASKERTLVMNDQKNESKKLISAIQQLPNFWPKREKACPTMNTQ